MNSSTEPRQTIPRELLCLTYEERPITIDEACDIRLLLFGNTEITFTSGWIEQGLNFRRQPPYGFLQKMSGPCGVLAAVQAYVIYELLFGFSRTVLENGYLRPDYNEKKEALARALANILWQAGQKKGVILAKKSENVVLDESMTTGILLVDGLLEYVKLKYFGSLDSLLEHLYNFIQDVMREGGCILFLYSVILTHGIDRIKEEMDYPESHLIGDDGYCSQEVVNLIIIGKAVPNVFNGDIELNSGGEETSLHKGIPEQSKIGFLSLFEYHGTCIVGSYYKDPEYPIWVLLGQSHFTVLFGTSRDIFNNPDDTFVLFHTDGLLKKNAEKVITINPTANQEVGEKDPTLPVVFHCIYTRWPFADIDVNVE